MAALLYLTAILLLQPSTSHAHTHKQRLFLPNLVDPPESPSTFFEVKRPIQLPKVSPCSSLLLLQHDFGFTFGQPPVTVSYTPPVNCPSLDWSTVVLEWSATCKGRQFDRIFGVWLGGVEILRSCTAEPRATGIYWKVEKDITRFSSLLKQKQTLSIYLGNLVNNVYTGIYHANLTLHFYPKSGGRRLPAPVSNFESPADLILPISRPPPLNDGYWFILGNSGAVQQKQFKVPQNAYRAVLEVYISFHSSDEFWYSNPPNEYISSNNLTSTPGNGAFREVVVSLDGKVVGAVCPFTVIYTGGINPLLWRPITGIGSFDLPSYEMEITPFLGELLDLNDHTISFNVTDGLNMWFIDANLHLWLDSETQKTFGKLVSYSAPHSGPNVIKSYEGLDGSFDTDGSRYVSATGWVKSSHGNLTTDLNQHFAVRNLLVYEKEGNSFTVNQTTYSGYYVYFKSDNSDLYSIQENRTFVLYLHQDVVFQKDGQRDDTANVSLGIIENSIRGGQTGSVSHTLENSQEGSAYFLLMGGFLTGALGTMAQVYRYDGHDGCYFRNVSSSNYTILHDQSSKICTKRL
ncbi:unnamed protein product [Victoria cruziana]